MPNHRPPVFIILVIIVALITGCAANEVVLEPRQDAVIATAIKAKLVDDSSVDAAAVSVDSNQGTVVLSGFVETEAERQRVEALAKSEPAVSAVVNRLIVK